MILGFWTIGIIGIAVVAYLFMLFAYSSMEEPKNIVYYSRVAIPKASKTEKQMLENEVVLSTLVEK